MASDEPASHLTLQTGTEVVSTDGERIGTVDHVLTDEATGIFDGLIIDTSLGPGGLHFADASEVAEIHPDLVVLTIPAAKVDQLPKPSPSPAVMEHHGAEDSEGTLEHKLRRAWEIISGRG